MPDRQDYSVTQAQAGMTLGGALRRFTNLSWGQAKKLLLARRVEVNGTLAVSDARRLIENDTVTVLPHPAAPVPRESAVKLLHIDGDLVVIEKPPRIVTVRHRDEDALADDTKDLQPTVQELVARLIAGGQRPPGPKGRPRHPRALPEVYVVHRLDRDTSGLMLFALSPRARDALVSQFTRHAIRRKYLAVAVGMIASPLRIESHLTRDRGDGLRGSTRTPTAADKLAITHVRPLEHIRNQYTLAECELETGRTHQIRIHLAEANHMLCGEKLYKRPHPTAPETIDGSHAPRQALHSTTLHLTHPVTQRELSFTSPLPKDLEQWLARLKTQT